MVVGIPLVRAEAPADYDAVRALNREAFAGEGEARLVDAVRGVDGVLSYVAEIDGGVVGHILFTPVTVAGATSAARVAGLGPVAVRPSHQRQGVGALLIRAGLEECRRAGYEVIVLVGHAAYYPRFGFTRASAHGLRCEFPVPDEVFMVLELRPGALSGVRGVVKHLPQFAEAG